MTISSLTWKPILRFLFVLAIVSICGTAFSQSSQLNKSNPAVRKVPTKIIGIDFCLIKEDFVKGLTHSKGVRLTDAATLDDLDYPLVKPTFTLTSKHIKSCELKASINPFNKKPQYDVCVELNDLGRAEMFVAFKGVNDDYTKRVGSKGAMYLWVVNGKPFPATRYFRPDWTTPKAIGEYGRPNGKLSIGAFSERNREFGQSFVNALKPGATDK